MKTVVVGLSGGVDSSVSALLLKQQGYRVIGLYMKNWDETDAACPSVEDAGDAALIAQQLDIPIYTVDFQEKYWQQVFEPSLDAFRQGITPNPDVWCNQYVKFDVFFKKAKQLGADYLATGHYCRRGTRGGQAVLRTGRDPNKDQSYFLHSVRSEVLEQVLFPIGDLEKPAVRALAREHGLATATKKDSTGICFIGKRDFKDFLSQYLPQQPGNFVDPEGHILGRHDGCAFYTIGQRKGLGIGGPGEAWFVAGKAMERNEVILVQGDEHPLLWRHELTAHKVHWISGEAPALPRRCQAKIRYRSPSVSCTMNACADGLQVSFETPQRAVTPGQFIVFYEDDICLGGATILHT